MKNSDSSSANWILVTASILFTLLLLEGSLRLVIPLFSNQPEADAANRHHYDPIRSHRLNPAFNTRNNTAGKKIHSAQGFRRDTSVQQPKPQNVIRIFALGGSALYGLGMSNDAHYPNHRDLFNNETIPFFLEQRLNEKLAHEGSNCIVEVINAGTVAYRTSQELIYLNSTLLDYAPDIIISVDGHNGFYGNDPSEVSWRNYGYGTYNLLRTINNRDFIAALHTFFRWGAKYSMLATQLEKRVSLAIYNRKVAEYLNNDQKKTEESSPVDYATFARNTYLRDLWQTNRLGIREGYEHIVFLQPEILLEQTTVLSEHDRLTQEITIQLTDPGSVEDYQRKRAMMPALFQEEKIPFVDIGDVGRFSDGKTDLYIDYCHLTPAGSRIVADRMFDQVYALVQKRARNCTIKKT